MVKTFTKIIAVGRAEGAAKFPVLAPLRCSTSRVCTVKMQVQATPGTSNSGWVFGMVVLSNSVEAEISQVDYQAQPLSLAILLGIFGGNYYLCECVLR